MLSHGQKHWHRSLPLRSHRNVEVWTAYGCADVEHDGCYMVDFPLGERINSMRARQSARLSGYLVRVMLSALLLVDAPLLSSAEPIYQTCAMKAPVGGSNLS